MGRNLLSMTKIPTDDILEGLYKLRTRESEKLKTVLKLYDQEIHQKKIRTGDNCSFGHDINKRGKMTQSNTFPNSFIQQNERNASRTRSPEERVPVVECLDGRARITLKELAPIDSVKSGTLQNACSTRPRVAADLVKSAHMHIVRLMNNLVKGSKRMMTKVQ